MELTKKFARIIYLIIILGNLSMIFIGTLMSDDSVSLISSIGLLVIGSMVIELLLVWLLLKKIVKRSQTKPEILFEEGRREFAHKNAKEYFDKTGKLLPQS